jgi:hypothetical protein
VWSIDADTHETTVILGKQTALEVNIHQNGSNILYSYLEPGSGVPALRAFDINTSNLVYLPMATLAEKCAWSTEGTRYVYCAIPRQQAREGFIEEWYQGKLTSDDVLWRFDLSTGEAKQLIDLYEELKVRLDVIDPVVSTHDNYLVFRSLRNDYLWALRLPSEDQPAMAESSPTE